jgi:hypothetical protein
MEHLGNSYQLVAKDCAGCTTGFPMDFWGFLIPQDPSAALAALEDLGAEEVWQPSIDGDKMMVYHLVI